VANFIDRAVGWVAPNYALKRARARPALASQIPGGRSTR